MILSDRMLTALLPELIREPEPALVNAASIDIRVGHSLLAETMSGTWQRLELTGSTPDQPYWLKPGRLVLVATWEWITIPNGYAGEIKLKSSRAREGYNHALASWLDPGWTGRPTMEVSNLRRYRDLPLYPGLRFGQLIVHRLEEPAARPYAGRYQGASEVQPSLGEPGT